MKSTMSHSFSQVPGVNVPRAKFKRNSGKKLTMDAGYLVPFFADEALPGDTFNLRTHGFCRLATPLFPIMDNMFMETFYFAVPLRLIWNNFKRMMGEQDNPDDSTDFVTPKITSPEGGYGEESLEDYLGLPTKVPGLTTNVLFQRAYNAIWNDWFRDQNLQDSVPWNKDDGPDDPADYTLLRRGKRHDYFTSALPWPQKGDSVDIPIGSTAPVMGLGISATEDPNPILGDFNYADGSTVSSPEGRQTSQAGIVMNLSGTSPDTRPEVFADLSNATAATINQLRQAFQLQKMFEKDARGGSRYTEIVLSHFRVFSPDARLQRPEFLGGGSTPINITPIASTSETDPSGQPAGRNLADLAAIGTSSFTGHGFTKSFTEHCVIMGFVNVRADLNYQQGVNKMFLRSTKHDFYWPSLAQIGEQEILQKEIYATGGPEDEETWGFQERYGEYRYKPSEVSGRFRSNADESLDAWHLAQDFADPPTLSAEFIEDDPPIDRCIAVPTEPHFICDFFHTLQAARPMPLYGVPGNIDRL